MTSRVVDWLHLVAWGALPSAAFIWSFTGEWLASVVVPLYCLSVAGLFMIVQAALLRLVLSGASDDGKDGAG